MMIMAIIRDNYYNIYRPDHRRLRRGANDCTKSYREKGGGEGRRNNKVVVTILKIEKLRVCIH